MIPIDLANHTAVISGGSRGIGAATAKLFARAGANVAVIYSKNQKAARQLCDEIQSYGVKGISIRCSIEDFADSRKAVQKIMKYFQKIDHLVNSAGIWEYGAIDKISSADWKKTIDVNLNGTFNLCRLIIPIMKKQRNGCIVNVSSTAGQRGEAYHSHYAASKGGIIAFTKSISVELIHDGIRTNCVAPGWVNTEMIAHVFSSRSEREKILQSIPIGKIASPDDVAAAILFLCSKMATHIVGEVLNVNGGSVLCG